MRLVSKLAVGLAILGLGAWGSAALRPSAVNAQETLEFRVKDKKVVFSGGHAGDSYTFHSALYRDGNKVGVQESFGATTARSGKSGQNIFTASAKVPGGRIMWVGAFHFVPTAQDFTGSIVGGTGKYEGARGTVFVHQKPHGSIQTFRIH